MAGAISFDFSNLLGFINTGKVAKYQSQGEVGAAHEYATADLQAQHERNRVILIIGVLIAILFAAYMILKR